MGWNLKTAGNVKFQICKWIDGYIYTYINNILIFIIIIIVDIVIVDIVIV